MKSLSQQASAFERWVPGLRMIRRYEASWLPNDLAAGVTLGAVMVPVGLAFGELVGLPLAGLHAAIFPLIVYALFGSSRQLIIGPDASMAAIVSVSVAPLADGDVLKFAVLAGALAILIGLTCILGSLLRLGFMADFLAKPVIVGLMHGLAIVIAVGQLPKILAIKVSGETTLEQLAAIVRSLGHAQLIPLLIGAGCVAVILGFRRWMPKIPGQIVALIGSILVVYGLGLEAHGVSVIGRIPEGLPKFHLPLPSLAELGELVPIALGAALVAFSDTVVTARGFASRNHYRLDANQEMLALGLSNIASGLTQGIPVSGSGARTAVSESVGSRTQMTSIFAAITVGSAMLFLTPLLYFLPEAALGGILIAAAYNLCEFGEFPRMWRFRRLGFLGCILTMAGVVGIGVMPGIAIGVLFCLILLVRALAFPHDAVLGEVDGGFHDLLQRPEAKPIPGVIVYRFSGPLFFANCGLFRTRVEGLIQDASAPVRVFILDASVIFEVDLAACELLSELREDLRKEGVDFRIANLRDRVRQTLLRGWPSREPEEFFFHSSVEDAVALTHIPS